jgi:hypothetical protein
VALNWKSVTREHVLAAMAQIGASKKYDRSTGLVVTFGERTLAAKEVLREAYRLANKLPADSTIKFSSGDGTLNVLVNLGFDAIRLGGKVSQQT